MQVHSTSGPATGRMLITGAAGFIGSHLSERFIRDGWKVTGLDSMDPFYPRARKVANLDSLVGSKAFDFIEGDILDETLLKSLAFSQPKFDVIVHLAAKAGVRPSLADPAGYQRTNVTGTANMLELAAGTGCGHFVLASSSSVYGECPHVPWKESEQHLVPISPYAKTKLDAEALAQAFAAQHACKMTALRFFTAYGPRQRPDLAIHKFVKAISEGKPITLYGDGSTQRDYTYVDDIVEGVVGAVNRTLGGHYAVYNLGNSVTVPLHGLIECIETVMGRKAMLQRLPEQPGDVPRTWSDISLANREIGYSPSMELKEGLRRFLGWYHAATAGIAEGL